MIRMFSVVAIILILSTSCSRKVNGFKDGKRHGRWVFDDSSSYVYKGRFRQGKEIGLWRYYWDGKLIRKEKYRKNIGKVTFYHPNSQVSASGFTKLEITPYLTHWYYYGDWKYYDPEGKLISIKTYEKGDLVAERNID